MTENKHTVAIRAIYDQLSESEKFGLAFGLFPVRLEGLTKDDCVALMRLRESEAKQGRTTRTVFDK